MKSDIESLNWIIPQSTWKHLLHCWSQRISKKKKNKPQTDKQIDTEIDEHEMGYLEKWLSASSVVPWNTHRPAYIKIICEKLAKISDVGWWIEQRTAFGACVPLYCFCGINSISSDVVTNPSASSIVLSASVRYFSVLITLRALKLSKPVVGSSRNTIGGLVNN